MKTYYKILCTISLSLAVVGCSNKEVIDKSDQLTSKNDTELNVKDPNGKDNMSYMDNLNLVDYRTDGDGNIFPNVTNVNGDNLLGVMDSDFEWIIKPNDGVWNYKSFSEGLIGAAIYDEREIRKNDDGGSLLWGYMNEKGEWVIEPQFASVGLFSEGKAFVHTIEEDRDDLTNSRGIVIDKKGKELFEVVSKTDDESKINDWADKDYLPNEEYLGYRFLDGTMEYNHKAKDFRDVDTEDEDYDADEYTNFVQEEKFIIDEKGKKYDIPDITGIVKKDMSGDNYIVDKDYSVLGYKVYFMVENSSKATTDVYIYDLKQEKIVEKFNLKGYVSKSDVIEIKKLNDSDFYKLNNIFNYGYYLGRDDLERNISIIDYNSKEISLKQKDMYPEVSSKDWALLRDSNLNNYNYLTFDNGDLKQKEYNLKEGQISLNYKDYYWEEGNEYGILKDSSGKVLIDEDKKLIFESLGGNTETVVSTMDVEYRDKKDLNKINKGILNLDTLKILNKETFDVE